MIPRKSTIDDVARLAGVSIEPATAFGECVRRECARPRIVTGHQPDLSVQQRAIVLADAGGRLEEPEERLLSSSRETTETRLLPTLAGVTMDRSTTAPHQRKGKDNAI